MRGFAQNLDRLAEMTGRDTANWNGYLDAIRDRRAYFATATDHGHPTAQTSNLDAAACQALLNACRDGSANTAQREAFRGQMLTEMAGMLRYRRQVTETAGFYNCAGFNDDTRALASIPARHDLARRVDCRFLAELVGESVIREDEAFELSSLLTEQLVRIAYKLDGHAPAAGIAAK